MATMNVSLLDPMRNLIRRDQGEAQDEARWFADLDASITRGLGEEAAGELLSLEDACAEIRVEIAALSGRSPQP
jgi:hypothetical protein